MTSELKSCPFCGTCIPVVVIYPKPFVGYELECRECHATTARYDTEAEAVEAWNTRHVEMCENTNLYGYSRRFECSACGYSVIAHNCEERIDELPNYCPNCGRKVTA